MPRRARPEFDHLRAPARDAARRGVCVVSPTDVGDVVRTARADTLGRQVDAASRLGVSVSMLGGLERGAGGSQLDLTLQVLADLGLDVVLVPRDIRRSLRESPGTPSAPGMSEADT